MPRGKPTRFDARIHRAYDGPMSTSHSMSLAAFALLLTGFACSSKTPETGSASGSTSTGGGSGSDGGSGAASGGDAGATPTGFVNPPPGSRPFAGTNFWNVEWERGNIFLPDVDFASVDNPWVPAFLQDLSPYGVLRLMDWNGTNASDTPQAHFETRRKKAENQGDLVALEWQIDLCNRTKKDYWLNIPHRATSADWKAVAALVRDTLDPSLRVYVEWSNEVWNESFPQHAYATEQANALSLEGEIPASSFYVYNSVRLYETFTEVFGKENKRLVRVLAGFSAWSGPCEAHIVALSDKAINPQGTKPDFYAVAPYVKGESMAALNASIAEVMSGVASNVSCARKAKLDVIGYEGGPDSYSAGEGCVTLQHDTGMRKFYVDYLEALTTTGLKGPYMQYTHSGQCWGLKEKTTDALENSPKYQGLLDWLASVR